MKKPFLYIVISLFVVLCSFGQSTNFYSQQNNFGGKKPIINPKDTTKKHSWAVSFELLTYSLPSVDDGYINDFIPTPLKKENAYYWSFYRLSYARFFKRFIPFLNLQYQTKK